MTSFSTLGLGPGLQSNLTRVGYTTPTPIQERAIPKVLSGTDLIGIAQTGTGKTAAFVLPIVETLLREPRTQRRTPRALIVAPTRELAAQIEETVRQLAGRMPIRSTAIFGGVGERPQIDALRNGVDILVATPGRLLDLLGSRHVVLSEVKIAVLDEADRMLDMGFLPQIRRVVAALPKKRQTLLFSATFSREIESVAGEMLTSPAFVEIGRRSDPAQSVKQTLIVVEKSRKVDLLLQILRDPAMDSVLVFSRTRHGANKIARKLEAAGITTATLHSDRSQAQRMRALAQFKAGRLRVLVATDIAARGIDVEEISHVVNYDFPPQPEDYVHRIGRTGRAAATGDAVSFVTSEDEPNVRALEKKIGRRIERKTVAGFERGSATAAVTTVPAAVQAAARPTQTANPSRAKTAVRHPRPFARFERKKSSRPGQGSRRGGFRSRKRG